MFLAYTQELAVKVAVLDVWMPTTNGGLPKIEQGMHFIPYV